MPSPPPSPKNGVRELQIVQAVIPVNPLAKTQMLFYFYPPPQLPSCSKSDMGGRSVLIRPRLNCGRHMTADFFFFLSYLQTPIKNMSNRRRQKFLSAFPCVSPFSEEEEEEEGQFPLGTQKKGTSIPGSKRFLPFLPPPSSLLFPKQKRSPICVSASVVWATNYVKIVGKKTSPGWGSVSHASSKREPNQYWYL